MHEKLGKILIGHKWPILFVIIVVTAFFSYHALQIKVESRLMDRFPSDHPFIETFEKYKNIFGGASMVAIQLEVKKGDVFNRTTLEKIVRITRALQLLPAINNYQVTSIAQRKIKHAYIDPVKGLVSKPIMWPDVPKTDEGIEEVKHAIYQSPNLLGTLVSRDGKAAFITAGFFSDKMNPKETHDSVKAILAKEEDDNTVFSVIGEPIVLGHVITKSPELVRLFAFSILAMIAVLAIYFRDIRGVLIPLATALISAIWGMGFLGLMDYNFDILVIVVPFIISARALSHSVQLIERYLGEFKESRDRVKASVATFSGLLRPGMIAIITDAAGVILIFLTPIPMMQKLALMGAFWVLSIIVSDLILNPILLSILPEPKVTQKSTAGFTDGILRRSPRGVLVGSDT
jgi:hypothetical protein